MKNIFSQKSISGIFAGALIVLCLFASCDNFLNSGAIKEEIKNTIAYNNASEIQILIQPVEGTGSCVPTGNNKVKKGYDFEISFSENPAYSFIKWTAVTNDNAAKAVTEGVEFEDETSPKTKVKISNATVALRLLPVCEERIAVSGEPSPRYDTLGVSRDRSISVSFTKPLAESSFIFEENEIPAGAQVKKDFDGKIWAYTFEGKTYLKNVSITNNDDFSIAEHFTKPTVTGKLLVIGTDRTNPIEFNVGEVFKTVKVTLSKDITDTSGIKMNASKNWNYQITEKTDEQATVSLTSVAAEGSVYLAGQRDYSLGQKISLAFTEDADYQFVKWDYDPLIVYVADPESKNTTATVIEKTTEENPTQIKAVCAPRLRVTSFDPKNDSTKPYVSKNSSIVIVFNQNIPDDEENKAQLKNISIAMGGTTVKSSFKDPVINSNTITFIADNSNMLYVPEGQKKTVSVTVPADFYYTLSDGTKVTYGGNGISFDYKIDDTTLDKAEITFTAPSNSGEFTAAKGTSQYSLEQEVAIAFKPNDGWQFNGWIVKSGNDNVPESQIKIADKNALSTKLYVYEAVQGVTVLANASETLSFTASPSGSDAKPKDSDIVITFNKPLADECKFMLDKIHISADANNVDSSYEQRTLSTNVITIKNTSTIDVPQEGSKTITVTVPADFYYTDGSTRINLEETSFSFKIDYKTIAKTKVNFRIIDGETDAVFNPASAAGTINQPDYYEFYIDQKVPVVLTLNSGYQFYSWRITDANGNVVTDQIGFEDPTSAESINPILKMKEAGNDIYINALCYKRPVVSTASVHPYNANSATEFAKNEPIVITFDHAIEPETYNNIIVYYSAISSFNKPDYFDTTISSDNKTITLTPNHMLPLNHANETVTVLVPHTGVYYYARDGETPIYCSDTDFSWSYKINNSTMNKTTIRFATTDAAVTGRQINVGGTVLSSGVSQDLNEDQVIELEFPVEPGYEFAGWKVTPATSGYICSSDTYVTEKEITVKDNQEEVYLTLAIDNNKAVLTSAHAIGNGTDGYGVIISAKDVLLPIVESIRVNDVTNIFNTSTNICDSKIYIHFNKYIITDSVTCSSNGSVTITKKGDSRQHFESYFATSWKDPDSEIVEEITGYKTLVISPKNKIKELVSQTSDEFEFVIKLNANGYKIRDTQLYALQESAAINNSFEIGYAINGQRETTKPVIDNGSGVFRNAEKTQELSSCGITELLTDPKPFTVNHLSKYMYISITGTDNESGIYGLRVTETLCKTINNEDVSATPFVTVYESGQSDKKTYTFNLSHYFKIVNDGIIKLEIDIIDNAGNSSSIWTYYILKDTVINLDSVLNNLNILFDKDRYEATLDRNSEVIKITIPNKVTTDFTTLDALSQQKTVCLEAWWSYNKNEFPEKPNLEPNKNGICEFERDINLITYIRIIATDDFGNEKIVYRFIPSKPDFSLGECVIEDKQLIIHPTNENLYKELMNEFNWDATQNIVEYYINKNIPSDPSVEWPDKHDNKFDYLKLIDKHTKFFIKGDQWTTCYLEPGRNFYISICINIGKQVTSDNNNKIEDTMVSVLSDTALLLRVDNDGNVVTKKVGSIKSGNIITEDVLPHPLSLGIVQCEAIQNTGSYRVLIEDFRRQIDTERYSYKLRAVNTSQNPKCYETSEIDGKTKCFVLNLPTFADYTMHLVFTDKKTGQVYITPSLLEKALHLTADCVPPTINPENFAFYYSAPYATNLTHFSTQSIENSNYPSDETAIFQKNGKGAIDYWILPNNNIDFRECETYTEKELSRYTAKTLTYDLDQFDYDLPHDSGSHQEIIEIPYDGLDEGLYTLCVRASDMQGNQTYMFQPLINKLLNQDLPLEITNDNIKITSAYNNPVPSTIAFYYFDSNSNRWILYNKGYQLDLNSTQRYLNFADYQYGHWLRIVGFKKDTHKPSLIAGYYNVGYVYLDYWRYKGTANEISVEQKNIIPGLNGLQICCDAPTLVHTLYCSKKLTENTELQDITVWENKAMETGVVTKSSTFTYTKDNYSNIPSGYYYTTVIHFADGTKVMTEVQKKP